MGKKSTPSEAIFFRASRRWSYILAPQASELNPAHSSRLNRSSSALFSLSSLSAGDCPEASCSAISLSALFSTAFFPACAPATADAVLFPARPPAIPAEIVASVLTVCFCASVSVDKSVTPGYSIPAIAFAASSPAAAPAAPAAALLPCSAATAPPRIACATTAAPSLSPEP